MGFFFSPKSHTRTKPVDTAAANIKYTNRKTVVLSGPRSSIGIIAERGLRLVESACACDPLGGGDDPSRGAIVRGVR